MRGLKEKGRNVQVVTTEGVKESIQKGESVQGEEAQVQAVEAATIDLPTPRVESIVNDVNESNLVNVPSY